MGTQSYAPLVKPNGEPIRILAVDDEVHLTELLALAMAAEGWIVDAAADGTEALELARQHRPDAVVLDVMLPDMDGFEVLPQLRQLIPDVPVVFLTARDDVDDRVLGLTTGGDDYVTKPFSIDELIARLRAQLRRRIEGAEYPSSCLVVADLVLDHDSHEVSRGGESINLTATEFSLLSYLMTHQRKVRSKQQILEDVWHYDFGGEANIVELYISYLRRKIDHGRQPLIHTIRGTGYVIRPPVS